MLQKYEKMLVLSVFFNKKAGNDPQNSIENDSVACLCHRVFLFLRSVINQHDQDDENQTIPAVYGGTLACHGDLSAR